MTVKLAWIVIGLRIALLNVIKPQPGSGDGMTECAYQLYLRLRRTDKVDLVYPLKRSRRNDAFGLIYTMFLFGKRIAEVAKRDYDVIHIVNQELGFAAKILKENGAQAVITTVYDTMRSKGSVSAQRGYDPLAARAVKAVFNGMKARGAYNKGFWQGGYDSLVAAGLRDAITYSDRLIFSCRGVQRGVLGMFKVKEPWDTIYIGQAKEAFVKAPLPRRAPKKIFNIGYVGAISDRKNVAFILRTAKLLRGSDYRFIIYGSGPEYDNLVRYKERNGLDNVSFRGFAPESKLLQIYDDLDLFLYPTFEEGTSLPVFEAQARGLPVVLYRGNHLTEEVTKYCFVSRSERDAANIIKRIKDKGYNRGTMSKAMRYVDSFTWDRVAKETLKAYRAAIAHSKRT